MKIDYIVPDMGNHAVRIIGYLDNRDDWSYEETYNPFDALQSENRSELSCRGGKIRYYPKSSLLYYSKHGDSIKYIDILINYNIFIINYKFASTDDAVQIPSNHIRDIIKATIKKMLGASDPAEKDKHISLTALNWIKRSE